MARQGKNKALKKPEKINPDDLAPGIASGLTQGLSRREALEQFPVSKQPSGVELVRHMGEVQPSGVRRVPLARFVAEEDADTVWVDEPTGRIQKNVTLTFQPEMIRAFQAGEACLRCHEPQDEPFPSPEKAQHLPGCTYPIKERQITDFAMEFEGTRHLGPARPITEYMEQQEARVEKRKFIQRKLEGGGGKIPKAWLRDAHLFPDGVPEELL